MSLYLFTAQYPYSYIENFLEDEIPYLMNEFEQVYIIPITGDSNTVRLVPEKCYVYKPLNYSKNLFMYRMRGLFNFSTISLFTRDFFTNRVFASKKKFRLWLSAIIELNNLLCNRTIKEIGNKLTKKDVCYFYWGIGTNKLSVIWTKKAHMVSRFHGEWDLWEKLTDNYSPIRKVIAESLDIAIFISQQGKTFFSEKYANCKTVYFPLGSPDFGCSPNKIDDKVLRVVSCSSVYQLKRVHLIFESLNLLDYMNIEWTHIGAGKDFELLKNQIKNEQKHHLTVHLPGFLTHNNVIEYYKHHHFDIFINLSTSEGVPVSIMEAISFDIPVIATNVGGTSDIVTNEVGILVSENPNTEEVGNAIKELLISAFSPRLFWREHFNAAVNYLLFARMLKEISNSDK